MRNIIILMAPRDGAYARHREVADGERRRDIYDDEGRSRSMK